MDRREQLYGMAEKLPKTRQAVPMREVEPMRRPAKVRR